MKQGKLRGPTNRTKYTNSYKFFCTSLHLGAAVLSGINQARFEKIDYGSEINGKRIIVIDLPEIAKPKLGELVADFNNKRLSVSLYEYNQSLNFLRDRLFVENKTGKKGIVVKERNNEK